ncbi:MAG: IS110 family transposase [Gaiellaceae bacterium]
MNQTRVYCGVDVSAATLTAATPRENGAGFEQREFANSAAGHKQLMAWLGKGQCPVRVTLEATGVYSLDLALALEEAEGFEVEVLNPKKASDFAKSLGRSKTDTIAAVALAEYSQRMKFVAWRRPSRNVLELRALGRHMATLTEEHTRLRNRLHAAEASRTAPRCVRQDLKRTLAGIDKRLLRLRREARSMIDTEPETKRKLLLLIAMPGIAEISAVQILAELAGLDEDMTVRQWVAHSGLDPAHETSGTSVHKPSRISRQGNRYLRKALYMPALSAARFDPHLKTFYLELLARHKTKLQALTAVARKMLHAIYGIFKTDTPYDGAKLFPSHRDRFSQTPSPIPTY